MIGLEEPRLVGLLDGQGRTLGPGVIREVDGEKERLIVETPSASRQPRKDLITLTYIANYLMLPVVRR